MKVLKKLQQLRCELQKKGLKKSGKNKFAGFDYYELSDFLPSINDLCLSQGLTTVFNFTTDRSILEIIDLDDQSKVSFEVPAVIPEIKGANAVQNLGGAITYLRRYLFLTAFEIVESDVSDATIGETPKPAQIQEIVPKDISFSLKSENSSKSNKTGSNLNDIDIIPIGKNKGKRWSEMSVNDLKSSLAYYHKLIQANPGSPYKDKNQEIIDYITNILLGR